MSDMNDEQLAAPDTRLITLSSLPLFHRVCLFWLFFFLYHLLSACFSTNLMSPTAERSLEEAGQLYDFHFSVWQGGIIEGAQHDQGSGIIIIKVY